MNYIIGTGGVGSWVAPALCLLVGKHSVTLIDGDTLEPKNLNRQLFTSDQVGMNKAEALAEKYDCGFLPEWYSPVLVPHEKEDWLICLVDNHPARLAALQCCDTYGCRALFGANETHSSEAYVYLPEWHGTRLDPRVYYPEINTDQEGDPRRAAIGCTGEAQTANPQLVTANFMAAALVSHLYVVWAIEARKLDASVRPFLPHKLVNNLTANETHKCGELTEDK